jgi:trk system potassium uptake protein TrkA
MKHSGHDNNSFGIIGLGKFGLALAKELVKAGKDVVVLEKDESRFDSVKGLIEHLYPIEQITQDILVDTGISHCGTAIVCIGKDIESNILTTLNLLELGIPRVISKAMSEDHGRVLRKIGAEVVFPETEMGLRLARSLITLRTLDFLELAEDISISEVLLSKHFDSKTIEQLNFRKRFKLNIIAITHENRTEVDITANTMLYANDEIVVIGRDEDLHRFQDYNGRA